MDLFKLIADQQMEMDSLTNQYYFMTIILEPLIDICKHHPHKIEALVEIFHKNCMADSFSKFRLFKNIKDLCV